MAGEPRVADMNISDEHFIVEARTSMKQVADLLLQDHKAAILVRDRKEGRIVSALNAVDLIHIVAEGRKPGSIRAIDVGRDDIAFLPATMMLTEAISIMRERSPEAVIIVDDAGDPVGYFSPDDYGDAVSKIDQHRKRIEAVQHSVDNTPGPSNDLLDALGEDNDAEEEEEVELPEDPFNSMGDTDDEDMDDDDQAGDGEDVPSSGAGFEEMSDETRRLQQEAEEKAEQFMSSMRGRVRGDVDELEELVVQSEPEDVEGDDEQALDDVDGHLMVENNGIETDDDFGGPEDVEGDDDQALDDVDGHLMVEHTGIQTDDDFGRPEDVGGGFSVDDILNDDSEQEAGPAPAEPTSKVRGPPKRPHRARQGAAATIPRRMEDEEAHVEPEVAHVPVPTPIPEPTFEPEPVSIPEPAPATTDAHDYNEEADDETWLLLKDSTDPYDFEFYIEHFPKGKYAVPAKLKLKQLQRKG